MFFTAIALMMVTLLVLSVSPQKPLTLAEEIPALQTRANIVNEQAKALVKSYVPQSVYVASYSAFFAISEYMRLRGTYFTTNEIFDLTFKEVMINGTMCCEDPPTACDDTILDDVKDPSKHTGIDKCIDLPIPIMRDRNLSVKIRQIENLSFIALRVTTEFNKNYDNMFVRLFQDNATGPWQVGVNLTINYSVSAGDVMINDTENISVRFNIEGIPDPLYAVGSQSADEDAKTPYSLRINATNITHWNISNLYQQLDWRFYKHDENASSFLMRFYGQDERSPCCGIESLINPITMPKVKGLRERPYVDWCYYGPGNRCTTEQTGAMWNVTCVTKETDDGTKFYRFAISTYHAAEYNITDYLYGLGPPPACPVLRLLS
jgi:hypothetical protein